MNVIHRHMVLDDLERLQRQTAIHRRCLLLLRARLAQAHRQRAG